MIGGAGGICSEIAYSFLANGDKIFAIDNRPGAEDVFQGSPMSAGSNAQRISKFRSEIAVSADGVLDLLSLD